jgi:hypothetical protein
VAARGHRPPGSTAEHEHRPHHDLEPSVVIGEVGVGEPGVHAEPRIVHHHLDGPVGVFDACGYPRDLVPVEEIRLQDLHVDRQFLRHLREPHGIPGDQHQVEAFGRQLPRELRSDTGRPARDQSPRHSCDYTLRAP